MNRSRVAMSRMGSGHGQAQQHSGGSRRQTIAQHGSNYPQGRASQLHNRTWSQNPQHHERRPTAYRDEGYY